NPPVSLASAAAHSRQAADRLGWVAGASQSRGVGVCPPAEGSLVAGVPSRLRAGTESRRVPVVALEAARAAQLLPGELRPVEFTGKDGSMRRKTVQSFYSRRRSEGDL